MCLPPVRVALRGTGRAPTLKRHLQARPIPTSPATAGSRRQWRAQVADDPVHLHQQGRVAEPFALELVVINRLVMLQGRPGPARRTAHAPLSSHANLGEGPSELGRLRLTEHILHQGADGTSQRHQERAHSRHGAVRGTRQAGMIVETREMTETPMAVRSSAASRPRSDREPRRGADRGRSSERSPCRCRPPRSLGLPGDRVPCARYAANPRSGRWTSVAVARIPWSRALRPGCPSAAPGFGERRPAATPGASARPQPRPLPR